MIDNKQDLYLDISSIYYHVIDYLILYAVQQLHNAQCIQQSNVYVHG